MNEIDTTPLPYACISPEWGVFMNVRLILKADVRQSLFLSSYGETICPVSKNLIPQ